jgi:BirA family biotin operon repressor/biotin-[acetyl-CoA-carboxylase] ligase
MRLRAVPREAFARYQEICITLGRTVRVERAHAEPIVGVAERVDPSGALIVGGVTVAAGDVQHLRDAAT